jgi:hypothetical protein
MIAYKNSHTGALNGYKSRKFQLWRYMLDIIYFFLSPTRPEIDHCSYKKGKKQVNSLRDDIKTFQRQQQEKKMIQSVWWRRKWSDYFFILDLHIIIVLNCWHAISTCVYENITIWCFFVVMIESVNYLKHFNDFTGLFLNS